MHGCPFLVDSSPDWTGGGPAQFCCRAHFKGEVEHDELCQRKPWRICSQKGCKYIVTDRIRSKRWGNNRSTIFDVEHCCYSHYMLNDEHSEDCQHIVYEKNMHFVDQWVKDPIMFHKMDFLKKFSNFSRFLKRGARYMRIDMDENEDLGVTNF